MIMLAKPDTKDHFGSLLEIDSHVVHADNQTILIDE